MRLFFLFLLIFSLPLKAEKIGVVERLQGEIKLQNGKKIKIVTDDLPILSSLRPILFIIPAKKYQSSGEIFERVASASALRGVFVVRFDWSFSFEGLSPGKEKELVSKDIEAVFKHFSKVSYPYLDQSKVLILAKSFGATMFTELFSMKSISSILLLTPNCDLQNTYEKRFGSLYKKYIPVDMIISNEDPYCDVAQIKDFQKNNSNNQFVYLSGDHNFDGPKRSVDSAVRSIMSWLKRFK